MLAELPSKVLKAPPHLRHKGGPQYPHLTHNTGVKL